MLDSDFLVLALFIVGIVLWSPAIKLWEHQRVKASLLVLIGSAVTLTAVAVLSFQSDHFDVANRSVYVIVSTIAWLMAIVPFVVRRLRSRKKTAPEAAEE